MDGTYSVTYIPQLKGDLTLSVVQYDVGGLRAEYWDNLWFNGDPVVDTVDLTINMEWSSSDLITPIAGDFITIRWTG